MTDKEIQIELDKCNERLETFWNVVQIMKAEGRSPQDPDFDIMADYIHAERRKIENLLFLQRRFYYSRDNNLEWS